MNSNDAKPVQYLTASDLYNFNDQITEGHTFVRDVNLLNSAAKRPMLHLFGQEQFPTILDKAASLLHSLAYHHLFADGNKRTALMAVTRFLEMNGYEMIWDEGERYRFILEVAKGEMDVREVAERLKGYVREG
jgi:death on curing protein